MKTMGFWSWVLSGVGVPSGTAHFPDGPDRTLFGLRHPPNPPRYDGPVNVTDCGKCARKSRGR